MTKPVTAAASFTAGVFAGVALLGYLLERADKAARLARRVG